MKEIRISNKMFFCSSMLLEINGQYNGQIKIVNIMYFSITWTIPADRKGIRHNRKAVEVEEKNLAMVQREIALV